MVSLFIWPNAQCPQLPPPQFGEIPSGPRLPTFPYLIKLYHNLIPRNVTDRRETSFAMSDTGTNAALATPLLVSVLPN
jgi:hypothetical protein